MWPFTLKKGPLRGYRVDIAAQDRVARYADAVAAILNVLGHPEALVTDESTVGDFDPTVEEVADLAWLTRGTVTTSSYIADLAEVLSNRAS